MDDSEVNSFRKLSLLFPESVFELLQQVKNEDSLSFQASGNNDVMFHVSVKKTEGRGTQFDIVTTSDDCGVIDLQNDQIKCHLKEITSEAFLLPGGADGEIAQSIEKNAISVITNPDPPVLTSPIGSPTNTTHDITALLQPVVDDEEITTVITPVPNINDDIQQQIDNVVVSTPSNLANFVNPILKTEAMDENDITVDSVVIGENLDTDTAETEDFTEQTIDPLDDSANEEISKEKKPVGLDQEDEIQDSFDVAEITLGKNMKVTVQHGGKIDIVREEVLTTCDKMVQSDVRDLASFDNRLSDTVDVPNDTLDLDLSLNETASISEQATNILKKLMEKGGHKLIDPNSVIESFPIIKEDDKYKCHICSLLLLKKEYLVAHMRYVHKICVRDPLSLMQCPYCPATFTRKNRYDEHLIHKHTEEKPHVCDMEDCNMKFKTVYNLRDHKRIFHYRMLRYSCDICNKQYENPNTVVRHRKLCAVRYTPGMLKEEPITAEELRNPNWIPINDLFNTPPPNIKKIRKQKQKKKMINKENILVRKRTVKLEEGELSQEELLLFSQEKESSLSLDHQYGARSDGQSANESSQEPNQILSNLGMHIKTEKEDSHQDNLSVETTQAAPIDPDRKSMSKESEKSKSGGEDSREVIEVTVFESGNSQKYQVLGKRNLKLRDQYISSSESPVRKKLRSEDLLSSVNRKSRRLAGQGKRDYKKMVMSKSDEGTGNPVESKAAIDKTEEDSSLEESVDKKLKFKVQGVLNSVKVYTINHDELCRRMYGPETMNMVTFMSFIKKEEGCSKIAEFKKKLVAAGYDLPKFTKVASSYSKLCEDEVKDVLDDFKDLQSEYFAEDKMVATFLHEAVEKLGNDSEVLVDHFRLTGILLEHIHKNLDHHIKEFDHVTHGFGPEVLFHFIELYQSMVITSQEKAKQGKIKVSSPEKSDKKKRIRGSPCRRKKGTFTVPGILPVTSTTYEVPIGEVERRVELPEQMGLTLLHSYLRKNTNNMTVLAEECGEMGLALQKNNRTWVQSCFSRLIEAEAKKLCWDFELLLEKHLTIQKLVSDVMKDIILSTNKVELTSILQTVRLIKPCVETTIVKQCEDFNLVTHGLGRSLAEISWTFVNTVAKKGELFCTKSMETK